MGDKSRPIKFYKNRNHLNGKKFLNESELKINGDLTMASLKSQEDIT